MNRKMHWLTGGLLSALFLAVASARADSIAESGRPIFTKYEHAVVTVQVVLKVTSPRGPNEYKNEITGTVVDPSGLTVLALSACDPTELIQRILPDSPSSQVDTEVTDIKILLEDGTEVPAQIVLRDKDLDLAFIRPKTKPATPMEAVDLSKSSPVQVLDSVITLNRLTRAAGRAYAASVELISAVMQKPRTFYIPDSNMTASGLGSPAFALNGNIVGIIVMRAISAKGAGRGINQRDYATSVILPAEDILKGAKQAPEVKPDSTDTNAPASTPDTNAPAAAPETGTNTTSSMLPGAK